MSEDNAVRVALADFADRRGEIDKRSAEQHALLRLNIAAAGGLATIVGARRGDVLLLLVLPPVASALAMLWATHVRVIGRTGDYIYDYIKPIVDPSQRGPLLHWEAVHDVFTSRHKRIAQFGLPVTLIFTLPSVLALLFTLPRLRELAEPALWGAWGFDVTITGLAVVLLTMSGIFAKPEPRRPGCFHRVASR